jgi:hypothetical protein
LRDRAEWTFEHLSEAYLRERVPREEVVTTTNLQELARRHGDRVVIKEFTPYEESRNGADWEWWFYSGTVGFGMRVQAKRAKPGGVGYELEHRVRGSRRLQSKMLVEDAAAAGCLPAYVLYNHRNWLPTSPSHAPLACRHGVGSQRQLGCTVVSALTVRAVLQWSTFSPTYVREHSVPWHRLLCDAEPVRGDALRAAWAEAKSLHRRGLDDLRMPVRAPMPESRARPRSEASPANYPPEPSRGNDRPSARDTAQWRMAKGVEHEVLDSPVHQALSEIAYGPVRRLPSRVRDMIADRWTEPPDERVAGAVLFNLGGE